MRRRVDGVHILGPRSGPAPARAALRRDDHDIGVDAAASARPRSHAALDLSALHPSSDSDTSESDASDSDPSDPAEVVRATHARLTALAQRTGSETHHAGLLGQGLLTQQQVLTQLLAQLDSPPAGSDPQQLASLARRAEQELAEHDARITQLYTALAQAHTGAGASLSRSASTNTNADRASITDGASLADRASIISLPPGEHHAEEGGARTRSLRGSSDARALGMDQQFNDYITSDLTRQLRHAQRRIRQLEENLASSSRQSETDASRLRREQQDLAAERDDWQNQFKRLLTEHEVLKEETYETEGQRQRALDEADSLRSDLARMSSELNRLRADLGATQSKADAEQTAREGLEEQLASFQASRDKMIQDLRRANAGLKRDVVAAQSLADAANDRAEAEARKAQIAPRSRTPQPALLAEPDADTSLPFTPDVSTTLSPPTQTSPIAGEPMGSLGAPEYSRRFAAVQRRMAREAEKRRRLEAQLRVMGVRPETLGEESESSDTDVVDDSPSKPPRRSRTLSRYTAQGPDEADVPSGPSEGAQLPESTSELDINPVLYDARRQSEASQMSFTPAPLALGDELGPQDGRVGELEAELDRVQTLLEETQHELASSLAQAQQEKAAAQMVQEQVLREKDETHVRALARAQDAHLTNSRALEDKHALALDGVQEELKHQKTLLAESRTATQAAEEQLRKIQERCESLTRQVDELTAERDAIRASAQETAALLSQAREKEVQLTSAAREASEKHEADMAQARTAHDEALRAAQGHEASALAEAQQSHIAALESLKTRHNSELARIISVKDEAENRGATLQTDLKALQAKHEEAHRTLLGVQSDLANAHAARTSHADEIQQLQSSIEQAQEVHSATRTELAKAQEELTATQERMKQAAAEHHQALLAMEEQARQADAAYKTLAQESKRQIDELKHALETAKATAASEVQGLERTITLAQQEHEGLQAEHETLKRQLSVAEKAAEDADAALREAAQGEAGLQQALEERSAAHKVHVETLKQDADELRTRLAQVQKEHLQYEQGRQREMETALQELREEYRQALERSRGESQADAERKREEHEAHLTSLREKAEQEGKEHASARAQLEAKLAAAFESVRVHVATIEKEKEQHARSLAEAKEAARSAQAQLMSAQKLAQETALAHDAALKAAKEEASKRETDLRSLAGTQAQALREEHESHVSSLKDQHAAQHAEHKEALQRAVDLEAAHKARADQAAQELTLLKAELEKAHEHEVALAAKVASAQATVEEHAELFQQSKRDADECQERCRQQIAAREEEIAVARAREIQEAQTAQQELESKYSAELEKHKKAHAQLMEVHERAAAAASEAQKDSEVKHRAELERLVEEHHHRLEEQEQKHAAALEAARQAAEERAAADAKALEAANATGDAEHIKALQDALAAQEEAHKAALGRKVSQWEAERAGIKEAHTRALSASNEGHARSLAEVQQRFDTHLAEKVKELSQSLAKEREVHEAVLKEQRERHGAALADKIAEATAAATLVATFKRRCEEAQAQTQQTVESHEALEKEVEQLRKACSEALSTLRDRDAELEQLREKLAGAESARGETDRVLVQLHEAQGANEALKVQAQLLEKRIAETQRRQQSSDEADDDLFHDAIDGAGTSPDLPTPPSHAPALSASKQPTQRDISAPLPTHERQDTHSTLSIDHTTAPPSPTASVAAAAAAARGVAVIGSGARFSHTRNSAGTFGFPEIDPPMFTASALLEEVHGGSRRRPRTKSNASARSTKPPDMSKPPTLSVPPPPSAPPPPGPAPQRSQPPIYQNAPARPLSPIPRDLLQRVSASSPHLGSESTANLRGSRSHATMRSRKSLQSDKGPAGTAVITGTSKYRRRVRSSSLSEATSEDDVDSFSSSLPDEESGKTAAAPATSPNGASTAAIPAVTATMIGSYLFKYVRGTLRLGPSDRRHKRYVWIHPYTKTLYWGLHDPSTSNGAESKAKSTGIEAVEVVEDYNPTPPGLYHKSITIQAASRQIKFTAADKETHDTWMTSLLYLLSRTDGPAGGNGTPQRSIQATSPTSTTPASTSARPRTLAGLPSPAREDHQVHGAGAPHSPEVPRTPARPGSRGSNRMTLSPPPVPPVPPMPEHRGHASPSPGLGKRYGAKARGVMANLRTPSPTLSMRSLSPRPGFVRPELAPGSPPPAPATLHEPSDSRHLSPEQLIDEDDALGVDNARACCGGMHDLTTLNHTPRPASGPRASSRRSPMMRSK